MEMPRAAHSTLVLDRAAENQGRQLAGRGLDPLTSFSN